MVRLQPLQRLARSIRHTTAPQLGWRLARVVRRQLASRLAPHLPEPSIPAVRLVEPLPHAVLAVRGGVLTGDGALRLVGREVPLTCPMAWALPGSVAGPTLERFVLHYMEWVDAVDDARCFSLMEDWIEANPRRGTRADWAAWSPYAVAVRCIVWMETMSRRGRVPSERIQRSLAQQLQFLARHMEWDLGGNHLLKDITALLLGARFFTGDAAERWRRLAEDALDCEIGRQFHDDGMHFERSPAYHDQVTADLVRCHAAVRDPALRERLSRTIDTAMRVGRLLTHPDGRPSLFGDGGLHMAHSRAALDAAWRSPPVQAGAFSLTETGYYGLRGPDFLFLAFFGRVGPDHLPAHGHGDIGSFEWSVAGQRFVVDPGVFEYVDGPRRRWSRSTRAHNTVTVGDADQAEFYGSFRVGRRPDVAVGDVRMTATTLDVGGAHNGFDVLDGAPVHHRQFAASPLRIDVVDRVEGGAGQPVVARVLVHPEVDVVATDGGVRLEHPAAVVVLETNARVRLAQATWSPDFGVALPTTQVELDYGTAPLIGRFSLTSRVGG